MIVVGTYGESPIKGAILGSTPHKLLHMSERPVLVVPGRCQAAAAAADASLGWPVSTWDQLATLPVEIERYDLEGRELAFSEEFVRYTTLITLRGGGEEGVGEDVVYDGIDHSSFQAAGGSLPLAGSWTLGSFSERLAELDTFPDPPVREVSRALSHLGLRVRRARPRHCARPAVRSPSTWGASCARSTTSCRCAWARWTATSRRRPSG